MTVNYTDVEKSENLDTYDVQCWFFCLCSRKYWAKPSMNNIQYRKWCFVISVLVVFHFYYTASLYFKPTEMGKKIIRKYRPNPAELTTYDKIMKYKSKIRTWKIDEPIYSNTTPVCKLNLLNLGPIKIIKAPVNLEWVEKQHPELKNGGFYAPLHCRSRHKVAILVPYRDRELNLAIFLRNIHPFLQKQLLEYRIFVIEQFGTKKFNKGSLYNVAYLETQQFGMWHCLIFHDVDLIPLDSRILYSCPRSPTHMSPSVESQGYKLPYNKLFGGVTVMTPKQFDAVNGYSNSYWNWGAEDDDMYISKRSYRRATEIAVERVIRLGIHQSEKERCVVTTNRLQAKRFPMLRYNASIARYATLPHQVNEINSNRYFFLSIAKRRFRFEGLRSITYKLINITEKKLFTHILADINPYNAEV